MTAGARACLVMTALALGAIGFSAPAAAGVPSIGGGASTSVAPTGPQQDSALEGEASPVKDLIGGGILVVIVATAAIGLARSSRRLR